MERDPAKPKKWKRLKAHASVERRTVQHEILERLRKAIISGMFQPGDRLVEADLCTWLGVSRTSLREALRGLHAERLVELVPNRGPHIPVLSWKDADDIYKIRVMLEGEVAIVCAQHINTEGILQLEAALAAFKAAVETNDSNMHIEATTRFYNVMLEYSGNRIIEEILSGLLARITLLRVRSMLQPGRSIESLRELSAICKAISAKDAGRPRQTAEQHVICARDAAYAVIHNRDQ